MGCHAYALVLILVPTRRGHNESQRQQPTECVSCKRTRPHLRFSTNELPDSARLNEPGALEIAMKIIRLIVRSLAATIASTFVFGIVLAWAMT